MPLCICESIQDLIRMQIPVQKVEVVIVSLASQAWCQGRAEKTPSSGGWEPISLSRSSHMCTTDVKEEVAKDRKQFSKKLPVAC